MAYTPPSGVVGATWEGAEEYLGPYSVVPGAWYVPSPTVYAVGFPSSVVQTPPLVTKQQFVAAEGFSASVVSTPLTTFATQYRPPYSTLDANWVGADSYAPPTAILLATWVPAEAGDAQYTYPVGLESSTVGEPVAKQQQFVTASGWGTEVFGSITALRAGEYPPPYGLLNASWSGAAAYLPSTASVYAGWNQRAGHLSPFGRAYSVAGTPDVQLRVRYVFPATIANGVVSDATIENTSFGISVGGIAPPPQTGPDAQRQLPSPFIADRIRYAKPSGIAIPANQIATAHVIAFDIQYIDLAGRGLNPWVTGNARIEYAVRYIAPTSIASNIFGSHNVARIQVVAPTGWGSSSISENHEFDIDLQRLLHHSGVQDQAGYGETTLRNQFENVDPLGWQSSEINFPVVFNLDQHLLVQPYAGTNDDPTQWPNYSPFVENKKRYLGPGGFRSSRFSVIGNWIWNKAAPITPEGVYGTEWGADTFIAFRIRKLGQEGWDSFYSTQYTVVYNDAEVLAPSGWSSVLYGRPDPVFNLNRTAKHHSGWVGPEWGVPFVAYGVRTVSPRPFNDVPAGFPEVRHNPYPIAAVGIPWQGQVGGHEVRIFLRQAFPKSVNVHSVPWFGEGYIRNRNQDVYPYAYEQTEFGDTDVQNFVRYVSHEWFGETTYGITLISRRTRVMAVPPISPPTIHVLHRVRNVLPDPPSTQLIVLSKTDVFGDIQDGDGIPPPVEMGRRHTVKLNTIFPDGIYRGGSFGQGVVHSTTIIPKFFFTDGEVGKPTLVYDVHVSPIGIEQKRTFFGTVRMTPWNIYAPGGDMVPYGYTPYVSNSRPIDEHLPSWDGSKHPVFGRTEVTNKHRGVGPVPAHEWGGLRGQTKWGTAAFTLRLQVVRMDAIRSMRIGFPTMAGYVQEVRLDDPWYGQGIPPSNRFGATYVAPPFDPHADQYVSPPSAVPPVLGSSRVELLHRTYFLTGIPHRGNPQQSLTSPWGRPTVGYPREYSVGMGVQSLWGNLVIEYVNREVAADGWNNLSLEAWDIADFEYPMKVTRTNPETRVGGIPSTLVVGTANVTHIDRTVVHRGFGSQRIGAIGVSATAYISPAGWGSSAFGDIDRWEEGVVKPHGDDLSSIGTPRIVLSISVVGTSSSTAGDARVAASITPFGLPTTPFDGPVVTNPFGCNNRAVSPVPIISVQHVPEPVFT